MNTRRNGLRKVRTESFVRNHKILILFVIVVSGLVLISQVKSLPVQTIQTTQNTQVIQNIQKPQISQNTQIIQNPQISQTTAPLSTTIIYLTDKPITFTFYPNQKQWFSTTIVKEGAHQCQPATYATQKFSVTFNPNVDSFSFTKPESRMYFIYTEIPVDEYYTEKGGFPSLYSMPGFGNVHANIHIIEVTKDHMIVTIRNELG
jgi:hypothetical protein